MLADDFTVAQVNDGGAMHSGGFDRYDSGAAQGCHDLFGSRVQLGARRFEGGGFHYESANAYVKVMERRDITIMMTRFSSLQTRSVGNRVGST